MRCLFRDNLPLAQLVLRIIMDKPDLVLTRCETQKDMKRLAGARSICLDAHGVDFIGNHFDMEIQREGHGADPHRARYHSSVLDIENLHAGQEFHELPDTCTIFITEKDFYGMGAPVYRIERMNLTTGEPFHDGEHILYVNGEYRGDTALGKLMHDFNCIKADEMVLVYKCGQEKLNNLYYQVKEQRRCSAWRKTKNPTPRNSSSRSWICTMPEELRIHNWNVNMA